MIYKELYVKLSVPASFVPNPGGKAKVGRGKEAKEVDQTDEMWEEKCLSKVKAYQNAYAELLYNGIDPSSKDSLKHAWESISDINNPFDDSENDESEFGSDSRKLKKTLSSIIDLNKELLEIVVFDFTGSN